MVITTLFWIAVVIRIPTYMTFFVKDEPECGFLKSKVLMTIDSEYQMFLLNFDFVVQVIVLSNYFRKKNHIKLLQQ